MLDLFKNRFISLFSRDNKPSKIGIFGPPNAGKSTLTNQICLDWEGERVSSESSVAHETRKVNEEENVSIKAGNSEVTIDIVDTPGVATEVDDSEFVWEGMNKDSARRRAREATEGIAEAMHWLREDVDGVIYMMDSTEDPFRQVNTMILGIIESRDLPCIVLANKTDLRDSDAKAIANAFPQHTTIPVSVKEKENLNNVYKQITKNFGD